MVDASPPRTFPDPILEDEVFDFSASAINAWSDCHMRYGFQYVDGIKGPMHPSAARGTAVHGELEQWLLKGQVPTDAVGKRLLPYLPIPTHPGLLVEHPFRILFPVGAARGFIDLLVPNPVLKKMPRLGPWDPEVPLVHDHKTTARLEFAKTEEDLRTDPQAILYGVEARRVVAKARGCRTAEVPDVQLQWGYSSTRQDKTKIVRLRQTLPILEDGLGPILETAAEMAKALAHGVTKDLDYDLRSCDKYGGCPHRAYCPAHQAYVFGGAGGQHGSDSNATDRPASDATEVKPMSDLLAKLKKMGQSAPKVQAVDSTPNPGVESAPGKSSDPDVTPEPSMPSADVSGTHTPIPVGTAPIVPPDAPPNVSPTDPPEPVAATEPEVVPEPKAKGKKKQKQAEAPTAVPVVDVEAEIGLTGQLERDLGEALVIASKQQRFVLASQLANVLICLKGGA